MARSLNRIQNPDFAQGTRTPRGWTWSASSTQVHWNREPHRQPANRWPFGVIVTVEGNSGGALWSQVVTCKPRKFYRIEATVSCDLRIAASAAGGKETPRRAPSRAGFVLSVAPMDHAGEAGRECRTPTISQSSSPRNIRTYYQAPDGVRRLRVSVGIVRAGGTARIHHVRMFEILEPEAESHALAVPPPPHTLAAPHMVQTVCVCSSTAEKRPITGFLRAALGARRVSTCEPRAHHETKMRTDAILLPDPEPPLGVRVVQDLISLAEDRIVIISLPAFAKLSRGAAVVRRIEQEDDPIHARITFASQATRGFALHDAFPYAWAGRTPWSFVQHQLRKTPKLDRLCKRFGLVVQLDSVCNREATSEKPVSLFKKTPGGGLYVLDIEPIEADSSTWGEPTTAMFWLMTFLGHNHAGLGQYVVPVRREADFRVQIRALVDRFPDLQLHEEYDETGAAANQMILVRKGRKDKDAEATRKPVILIRSGLAGSDVSMAYGALLWFKQLVRTGAHQCPYSETLLSRFDLIWIPYLARWELGDGWRPNGQPPSTTASIPSRVERIHALIDLVSAPSRHSRIVIPRATGRYARYPRWIPRLIAALTPGRGFGWIADSGGHRWGCFPSKVEVAVDANSFSRGPYADVQVRGGVVIRAEIPGCHSDFSSHSIFHTNLTATLLEWIVGLQYGLIVVNRTGRKAQVIGVHPLAPGRFLAIPKERLKM